MGLLGWTAIILSTTFVSCNDPCSDVVCKNNGICRDGGCVCADGFDGLTTIAQHNPLMPIARDIDDLVDPG